jgi:hypothetical protein
MSTATEMAPTTYGSTAEAKNELDAPLLESKATQAGSSLALRLGFCALLLLGMPLIMFIMMSCTLNQLSTTALLGTLPAIAMLVGSLVIVALKSVDDVLQAALQNFSAGIIIAAVGCELFPLITESKTEPIGYLALLVGFAVGLVLMFGVGWLIDDDDDDDGAGASTGKDNGDRDSFVRERTDSFTVVGTDIEAGEDGNQEAITSLIKSLKAEAEGKCDREKVDKKIHELEYLIDKARRVLREQVDISAHNKRRLVEHIQEIEVALRMRNDEGQGRHYCSCCCAAACM